MIRPRPVAFLSASISLAILGWWSFRPAEDPLERVKRITLWTAGAAADESRVSIETVHVALAAAPAPMSALRVADAASLRRRLPLLEHVEIRGDGVDPADAAALRPLTIAWQRPSPAPVRPGLVMVSSPLQVSIGQRVTVHGAVAGLGRDGARLTLASPDGSLESIQLVASSLNSAPFSISSSPARTAGEFEWQLRLEPGGDRLPLGVSVKAPPPPRVLLLQASPNPEVTRLLRWLTAARSPTTSRTRVSAERFRFTAAHGSPAEFTTLDDAVLKQFDVMVTTESGLTELKAEEQQALSEAVKTGGFGLLVVGGSDPKAANSSLLPWRLEVNSADSEDDRRLLRLRLAEGAEIAEWVTLAAPELKGPVLTRKLVQDAQGRILAAAAREGQGWLARSLVLDAWRWEQAGHPEAFSAYWADLLHAIARPVAVSSGRWNLKSPNDPRLVNEPIDLVWSGAANTVPPEAQVVFAEARERMSLPVAGDAFTPEVGRARYWPTSPGWHYVQSPGGDGAALAFFVHGPAALSDFQAERRRISTAALLAETEQAVASVNSGSTGHYSGWYPLAGYIAFGAFLASMAVIWIEERRWP